MNRVIGLVGSMLSLIGLYLVLRNATNATRILDSIGGGTVNVFRTLQGRNAS